MSKILFPSDLLPISTRQRYGSSMTIPKLSLVWSDAEASIARRLVALLLFAWHRTDFNRTVACPKPINPFPVHEFGMYTFQHVQHPSIGVAIPLSNRTIRFDRRIHREHPQPGWLLLDNPVPKHASICAYHKTICPPEPETDILSAQTTRLM